MDGFIVTVKIMRHLLVVVFTAIPFFKEFCKEVCICLMSIVSFNVLNFRNQFFLFSSDGLYSALMKASMMSHMSNSPVILPPKPITLAFNCSFA